MAVVEFVIGQVGFEADASLHAPVLQQDTPAHILTRVRAPRIRSKQCPCSGNRNRPYGRHRDDEWAQRVAGGMRVAVKCFEHQHSADKQYHERDSDPRDVKSPHVLILPSSPACFSMAPWYQSTSRLAVMMAHVCGVHGTTDSASHPSPRLPPLVSLGGSPWLPQ